MMTSTKKMATAILIIIQVFLRDRRHPIDYVKLFNNELAVPFSREVYNENYNDKRYY